MSPERSFLSIPIGMEVNIKNIDPSYSIRSQAANPLDSAFCLLIGHYSVHTGMAGKYDIALFYVRFIFCKFDQGYIYKMS